MPLDDEEVDSFLDQLTWLGLRYGHEAVVSVLSGTQLDKAPLVALRESAAAVFEAVGYWRANIHVVHDGSSGTRFHAWHRTPHALASRQRRFRLPFLNLETATFRSLPDRQHVEMTGRWYEKSDPKKAEDSTSSRSLSWLQQSLNQRETEPASIVHFGEMGLWLLAMNPNLLPLGYNYDPDNVPDDARYSLKYGNIKTPFDVVRSVLKWIRAVEIYDPNSYRSHLWSVLSTEHRRQLEEILESVPPNANEEHIRDLSQRDVFVQLRELAQSTSGRTLVRFRLTEPLNSGTKAIIIWPISLPVADAPYGGISTTALPERRSIFCLVVPQPHFEIVNRATFIRIRSLIERILLLTIPTEAVTDAVFSLQATAYQGVARVGRHETRNLSHALQAGLKHKPAGPHDDLLIACQIAATITDCSSQLLDGRRNASTHSEVGEKLEMILKWKSTPTVVAVHSPGSRIDSNLLAVVLELARNAHNAIAWQLWRHSEKQLSRRPDPRIVIGIREIVENGHPATEIVVENEGKLKESILANLARQKSRVPYGRNGLDLAKWTVETIWDGTLSAINQSTEGVERVRFRVVVPTVIEPTKG